MLLYLFLVQYSILFSAFFLLFFLGWIELGMSITFVCIVLCLLRHGRGTNDVSVFRFSWAVFHSCNFVSLTQNLIYLPCKKLDSFQCFRLLFWHKKVWCDRKKCLLGLNSNKNKEKHIWLRIFEIYFNS